MVASQTVGAILELVTAAFFCMLGWHLTTRFPTSPRGAPAMRGFSAYWLCQGLAALLRSGVTLAAAAGVDVSRGELHTTVLLAHGLVLAGIAGFLFYVVYIFVGRAGAAWTALLVYLAFGAGQWWLMATGDVEAAPTTFGVPFYVNAQNSVFPPQLAFVLALLPFVAGTVGFFYMGVSTKRTYTKFRATLVGSALLFWALASAAGYALRIGGLLQLTPELVALIVAVAVYLAYFPPGAVTRWIERREALKTT
jgi:hypothetical protein